MYYSIMKTFRTQLQSKTNEFLFDYLAKMDTQSEEFWEEANSGKRISKKKYDDLWQDDGGEG